MTHIGAIDVVVCSLVGTTDNHDLEIPALDEVVVDRRLQELFVTSGFHLYDKKSSCKRGKEKAKRERERASETDMSILFEPGRKVNWQGNRHYLGGLLGNRTMRGFLSIVERFRGL